MNPDRELAEKYRIGGRGKGWKAALKDLFFGMFYYPLHQELIRRSVKYKDVIHVLLLGEFLGIPVLGSYYSLRVLPHIWGDLPHISRRVLRDWDVLELLHEGEAAH
jgi:hypothetical protein